MGLFSFFLDCPTNVGNAQGVKEFVPSRWTERYLG